MSPAGDLIHEWERQACRNCGHRAIRHVAPLAVAIWSVCLERGCPCREFEDVASLYIGGRA